MMKKMVIALILALSMTTQVFAMGATEYVTWLGTQMEEFVGDQLPGVAVAVVDLQNGFSFSRGYGYQDAAKEIPFTQDTLFQTGAISGSITALAALKMEEEGKIKLTDKVMKHLPTLKLQTSPVTGGNIEDVTVQMLMEHVSGLPDTYWPDFYSFDEMNGRAFDRLLLSLADMHMSFNPYDNVSYSDAAVSLLGYLLAKVEYPELPASQGFLKLSDDILAEIGMKDSSFWLYDHMKPLLSHTFDEQGQPTEKLPVASGLMPAVSLWSSATDMRQYLYFLLSRGNSHSLAPLFRADEDALYYEEDRYYGLTWFVYSTPWGTMYRLDGNTGYQTALIVNLDQKAGVFVACNGGADMSASKIANELITKLLEQKMSNGSWWAQAKIDTMDEFDDASEYIGYYYGRTNNPLEVQQERGILYIIHPETGERLAPEEDGRYVIDESGNWLSFKKHRDKKRNYNYYILQNGYPIAMKMITLQPSPHAENFYGQWVSQGENMKYLGYDTLNIEKDEKGLARLDGVLLNFLGKDAAYAYGFGWGYGWPLKRGIDDQGREYIVYGGERFYAVGR